MTRIAIRPGNNVLNHFTYSGPGSDATWATFGEINGAGGMREVQLNARLSWQSYRRPARTGLPF